MVSKISMLFALIKLDGVRVLPLGSDILFLKIFQIVSLYQLGGLYFLICIILPLPMISHQIKVIYFYVPYGF